jgi:hypothetical protein
MSLISIYSGGTNSAFLQKVEVAAVEIAREIITNELPTVAHHDARTGFARAVLTATDPGAVRRIGLLIAPGDSVDQSVNTDDSALKLAVWGVWNAVAGIV